MNIFLFEFLANFERYLDPSELLTVAGLLTAVGSCVQNVRYTL